MTTNNIKTSDINKDIENRFSALNCIVTNHAAPASVEDDKQALEFFWREIFCKKRQYHFYYLITPQGNVYLLNPCLLHHYFDNGDISYKKLEKSLYIDEYQLIKSLPYKYDRLIYVLNLCDVAAA